MREIGEDNIDDETLVKIKDILAKEPSQDAIRKDYLIALQWTRKKLNIV